MKRLQTKNTVQLIFGGIAAIAGIVAILSWFQIKPFNEKEVTAESVVYKLFNLTNKSDSLIVQYKGKSIDNLWKLRFSVRNTGKKSIIGTGETSDIYNDCIKFHLEKGYEIISYNILNDDFLDSLNYANNSFSCYFRKWKVGEKLQFDIWVQSHSANDSPRMILDERSIINPVVETKYTEISELEISGNSLDWLVDLKIKYPKFIFKIAKYVGLILGGMGLIMPLFGLFQAINTTYQYRRWKKRKLRTFYKELEQLNIDPSKKEYYKRNPTEIPEALRHEFSSLPPVPFNGFIAFITFFIFLVMALGSFVFLLFAWHNL